MDYQDAKVMKEVLDRIEKIKKLQDQLNNPTRDGMIRALMEAQSTAPLELRTVEILQGDIRIMSINDFTDEMLYRKVLQYKNGLMASCIAKAGERTYSKLMEREAGV